MEETYPAENGAEVEPHGAHANTRRPSEVLCGSHSARSTFKLKFMRAMAGGGEAWVFMSLTLLGVAITSAGRLELKESVRVLVHVGKAYK